ncbi:MAG: DUF885 domain-containing protein [Bacteroidales bacterium]|nr:DUF885 domain-containing protein [Bacteroidales bacterium]
MKKLLIFSFLILIGFECCQQTKPGKESDETSRSLNKLYEEYYDGYMELNPILATEFGDYRFNDLFPNSLTQSYIEKLRNFYTSFKAKLDEFDEPQLSEPERLNVDILKWECNIGLKGLNFKKELLPVDQFASVDIYLATMAGGNYVQPFRNTPDYENWLKRLSGFVIWCDTAIANMQRGMRTGYTLPKALVYKMIPQMDSFDHGPAEEHVFYGPVIVFPGDMSAADKKRLESEYKAVIEKKIIPAYKKLHDFLKNEYLPRCRETSGIDDIPYGKEYYQYLIEYYTTTELSADEIFEIGQNEVDRISREMGKIKDQVGFKGDLKEFFSHVRTSQDLMPFSEPEQVIANFNNIHEIIKSKMPGLFDSEPKTPLEVRRTEAFREKTASAEFEIGLPDGSRPAIFYVPIPDAGTYNILQDESLFLHEAVPGHYFQLSLQLENDSLPQFRKIMIYGSYVEGWAMYAETLGKELGMYSDPYQYPGNLKEEIHRAIRLVVDVGLHTKGWTREQAIQYSLDHEPESESNIIAEIERYMALPGQALAYKIGQLKFLELRAKAENTLGDKFNIKEFHNKVLESGCIPMQLFEDRINGWIDSKK